MTKSLDFVVGIKKLVKIYFNNLHVSKASLLWRGWERHKYNYTMKTKYIILLLVISMVSFAQKERRYIRSGNDEYKSKNYDKAEVEFSKATNENKESFDAAFDLGDALYRQEKFDQAEAQFSKLSNYETSKENIAKAYHNLGNAQLQQKKFEEAIESYKSALRNNPKDMETKYNLAYAQRMLQKQQQQQNKNKDKKDNKNKKDNKKDKQNKDKQNKDKQDKKDNKKDKQNKEQQNKNKDKKDQQKQQQPEQQKMSKKEAEQMLKSIQNDEKKLQKQLKGKKVKGKKIKVEKDW